jgi:hypothetical protein
MRLEDRSWERQAAPATSLDGQLAELPDGWHLVNEVDLGDRRRGVERVIVGPGGVFVVSAADHPADRIWVRGDGFLVNGQWMPYLRELRRQIDRVDRVLSTAVGTSVSVSGTVVLVADPTRCAIKRQPDDVHVAAPGTLTGWLSSLESVVDAATVDRIHAVLRRSSAWAARRAG